MRPKRSNAPGLPVVPRFRPPVSTSRTLPPACTTTSASLVTVPYSITVFWKVAVPPLEMVTSARLTTPRESPYPLCAMLIVPSVVPLKRAVPET